MEKQNFDINLGAGGQGASGTQRDTSKPSYYEVLNVGPNASKLTIRESYLRLKQTFGSGNAALYSLMNEDELKANTAVIEEAYRVLQDDIRRAEYDRALGHSWTNRRPDGSEMEFGHAMGGFGMTHRGPSEGQTESWDRGGGLRSQQVIMTTRSTLPIIKTTAEVATAEDTQAKLAALVAEGDPGDGDLFRRMREACGVSEDEILERTKISREYVRAIESNRFERLPQVVYVKGFLRSYFRYLAAPNYETLVKAFAARLETWLASKKN